MFSVTKDQTIALAGLYQSLALVQNIAWDGDSSHSCMLPTIESVLKLDIGQFIDAYGSIDNLQLGLQTLRDALQKRNETRAIERTRYAINLMYLSSKLDENPKATTSLGSNIERINNQYSSSAGSLDDIMKDLGEVYREHISPLGPKIIIEGDPVYLRTGDNAAKIRALLLAGIRAIVLWKQANGKRWTLLLARPSLLKNIAALQDEKSSR